MAGQPKAICRPDSCVSLNLSLAHTQSPLTVDDQLKMRGGGGGGGEGLIVQPHT